MSDFTFVPISLREANDFVKRFHRHNTEVRGHKFAIGLQAGGELVGVGIAGRPVARNLDDGRTVEIVRVCVKDGYPNACSKIYARMKRVGQLLGYTRIKTYTLCTESKSSLKAIRAVPDRTLNPQTWSRTSRPRIMQAVYKQSKIRWELAA